jgi:apolipoprotein N-acyltransferase
MSYRSAALAALSGALLALSFPTFNLPYLAWIALVPLFFALRAQTVKNGFLLGAIAGFVFFVLTVYWVVNSVHVYGHIAPFPATLIMLLLCSYLALYPALFGAVSVRLRTVRPRLFFIAAPAAWVSLELARTYVISGFPWALLGYSQCRFLPVVQIADLAGVYGVSFILVLANVSVAEFIADRRSYAPLLTSALVLAAVLVYGSTMLRVPEGTDGLTVSVIQGNIEQDKKWDRTYQGEVLAVYKRLTVEAAARRPDLVIWPEPAVPFYFSGNDPEDRALTADLSGFVRRNKVPLLFGSPTYEIKPNRHIVGRNSAFLLSAGGDVDAIYHKMHLVPFGEYVPLKSMLFFVDKLTQAIGDYQGGDEYALMTVPFSGGDGTKRETRICTVICYEIIFPDLVRRFVARGARMVTTVTNDAWFGKTSAPEQHFAMAVFRAVENRVPVARAANTGISGFIDSSGRILESSGIFTEASLARRLALGTESSFYTRYGDVFSYICFLFASAMLFGMRKPDKII